MDDKNIKTVDWSKTFGLTYERLLRIKNSMRKRMDLSYHIKEEVDSKVKDVDDSVKGEVWWELAARMALESHMLIDNEFSVLSDVLNKYTAEGLIVPCTICGGNKGVTCNTCKGTGKANEQTMEPCRACGAKGIVRCNMCGGSGKAVDHLLSLRYKNIAMIGTVSREVSNLASMNLAQPGQVVGGDEMPDGINQLLEQMYTGLYQAVESGELTREDAMTQLKTALGPAAKAYGGGEEEVEKFMKGYEDFEARMNELGAEGETDDSSGGSNTNDDSKE